MPAERMMRTNDVRSTMRYLMGTAVAQSDYNFPTDGFELSFQNIFTGSGTPGPRLEMYFESIDISGGTLKGNEVYRETGLAAVALMARQGAGETDIMDFVERIEDMFCEGQYFWVDDVNIPATVMNHDRAAPGTRPALLMIPPNLNMLGTPMDSEDPDSEDWPTAAALMDHAELLKIPRLTKMQGETPEEYDERRNDHPLNTGVYTAPNAGYIAIQKPVMVGSGYRDEAVYRLPVTVKYVATSFFTGE